MSNSLQLHGLQHQASLSFTIPWTFLQLMSIELVMPSSHLILCFLLLLPSIFPSIRVFSNESALRIRCPKYWNFSFSSIPSNEYSGLISFRINQFDLLAVQRTLKSLLQHRSLKAPVLQHSALFVVQLSYPYMTTGKTIALTIWTFVIWWCCEQYAVCKIMQILMQICETATKAIVERKICGNRV